MVTQCGYHSVLSQYTVHSRLSGRKNILFRVSCGWLLESAYVRKGEFSYNWGSTKLICQEKLSTQSLVEERKNMKEEEDRHKKYIESKELRMLVKLSASWTYIPLTSSLKPPGVLQRVILTCTIAGRVYIIRQVSLQWCTLTPLEVVLTITNS
jgi:hypothetical protein